MTGPTISDDELSAYLDGELPAQRRAEIEAWLAGHPADALRIAAWAEQNDAIRAAFPLPDAGELPVLAAARPLRAWRTTIAASLVAVSFAGGFLAGRISPAATTGAALAEAGFAAHDLYVPEVLHAVEVAAEQKPHLEKWLSNRVGAAITAPSLTDSGLTLLGGRLVSVDGAPAALLMYEAAGGLRYSVVISRAEKPQENSPSYTENGRYGAWEWQAGGFAYFLAGPSERSTLLGLTKAFSAGLG